MSGNDKTEAKVWREFWIHNSRAFGPITLPHGLLFASDKPNELIVNHEVVRCVEIGALNELKDENVQLKAENQLLRLNTYDYEETKSTNALFKNNILKVDAENKILTEKLRVASNNRDVFAEAMGIALKEGTFFDKASTKKKIETLLTRLESDNG